MVMVPVVPRLKHYGGTKPDLRRKASDFNRMAQRVADHVNTLIANNPDDEQQYIFHHIARDLGLTLRDVQSAVSHGGHNGITIRVGDAERRDLAPYKRP